MRAALLLSLACVGGIGVGSARADEPVRSVEYSYFFAPAVSNPPGVARPPADTVRFEPGLPGPAIPKEFLRVMRVRAAQTSFQVSQGRPSRTRGCSVSFTANAREELEGRSERLARSEAETRGRIRDLELDLAEDPGDAEARELLDLGSRRLALIHSRYDAILRALEYDGAWTAIGALWEETFLRITRYKLRHWGVAAGERAYSLAAEGDLGRTWILCHGPDLTSALTAGFGPSVWVEVPGEFHPL